jgi:ABC-type dipeptide/oligopeptide/nickel transport system permease subunit
MIAIPGAIFTESFLAFIGLGLPRRGTVYRRNCSPTASP